MAAASAVTDRSYLLDKLHSLSGVVPIGAFLLEHFFENSYALVSPEKYNWVAQKLETIPWRVPVEAAFIWLPILFHGGYGMYIWWSGKSNAWDHPWMANWMYTLQRWSGIVAFIYIGWHIWLERFATHGHTTYAGVAANMARPWYLAFYIAGITAASFHLGNGLWNFSCKWGITVTRRSQRAAGWFGAAVALLFFVVGLSILIGLHQQSFPLGTYAQ